MGIVRIVKDYGDYYPNGVASDKYFGEKVVGGSSQKCEHNNLLPLRMSEYTFFSSQTHGGTAKCLQVDTYICRDCGGEISLKDIKYGIKD